jgi:hypothetical protein
MSAAPTLQPSYSPSGAPTPLPPIQENNLIAVGFAVAFAFTILLQLLFILLAMSNSWLSLPFISKRVPMQDGKRRKRIILGPLYMVFTLLQLGLGVTSWTFVGMGVTASLPFPVPGKRNEDTLISAFSLVLSASVAWLVLTSGMYGTNMGFDAPGGD